MGGSAATHKGAHTVLPPGVGWSVCVRSQTASHGVAPWPGLHYQTPTTNPPCCVQQLCRTVVALLYTPRYRRCNYCSPSCIRIWDPGALVLCLCIVSALHLHEQTCMAWIQTDQNAWTGVGAVMRWEVARLKVQQEWRTLMAADPVSDSDSNDYDVYWGEPEFNGDVGLRVSLEEFFWSSMATWGCA